MSISHVLLLLALFSFAAAQCCAGVGEGSSDGSTEEPVQESEEEPTAWVEQGQLRGVRIDRGDKSTIRTLYAFLGIPYARPPLGPLRFQDPEEATPWTGIRNATAYNSSCIQIGGDNASVIGDENCLFLNVFTADSPTTWGNVSRSVLVVIHGGAFMGGSGDMDTWRPDSLLSQEIVVVSINYRLAVIGFLNTEDSQAPGNAGLKDQVMALRWVQRNIAAFGGDPSKVSILGQSAGAASVNYLMLSPLSTGLFRSAMSISGSALPTWARVEQPRRYAEALRRLFDAACPDDDLDAIVGCLQGVNPQELVLNQFNVSLEPFQNYILTTSFLPAVEAPGSSNAPFLTAEPEQLMREGDFIRVPYMTGYTSAEGIFILDFTGLLHDPSRWPEVDEHFADIFRWEMPPGLRTPEMALRMRKFYLGDRSLRNASQDLDTLERFVQMCTDLFFAVGCVNSARMMADSGATVYVYEFTRDGPIGFIKNLMSNASFIPGVTHGDDMAYLFDFTLPGAADPLPIPDSEVPIKERQVKIFANMIKFGNPTPAGSGLTPWPPFRAPQESYADMGEFLRILPHAGGDRIAFWRQLAADSPPPTITGPTAPYYLGPPSTQ